MSSASAAVVVFLINTALKLAKTVTRKHMTYTAHSQIDICLFKQRFIENHCYITTSRYDCRSVLLVEKTAFVGCDDH